MQETTVGFGTYFIDSQGYTYGYSHLETIRGDANGVLSRRVNPPTMFPLKLQWQGDVLMVIGQGADRRDYRVDGFNSPLGSNGDYRRWKRLR